MQVGASVHQTAIGLRQASSLTNESDRAQGAKSKKEQSQFALSFKAQLNQSSDKPSIRTIAATRTQLTQDQAASALRTAWGELYGEEPRDETVAVLTAQWSHETGNGRSMFNFNFGGIKGSGPSGLTVNQRTREGWGEHERTIRDNFRAYKNKEEGAGDYIGLLARRYPRAVEAAHEGNPQQFVKELKKGGYFTGNESAYVRSVSQKTSEILGRQPEIIPTEVAPQAVAHILDKPATVEHQIRQPTIRLLPKALSASRPIEAQRHWGPSPTTIISTEAFNDALSRAALSIALDPERSSSEDSEQSQLFSSLTSRKENS